MQITIHKSADIKASTQRVIQDKIEKLETFFDRIERADVYVKDDDGKIPGGQKVEVRLAIPGNDLFAEYTDESIERAIAEVADALRRQIRKYKDKHDHNHNKGKNNLPPVGPNDDAEEIYVSEEQL